MPWLSVVILSVLSVLRGLLFCMFIAENVADVRRRITAAARHVGRDPEEITLMAVSKTLAVDQILAAYIAWLRVVGDNREKEFFDKPAWRGDVKEREGNRSGRRHTYNGPREADVHSVAEQPDKRREA